MSNDCPNCGESMPMSCPVRVEPDTAAEAMESRWKGYRGVLGVYAKVDAGNVLLELAVDQSEYATNNHFKHRDVWENDPDFEVRDTADGVVEVVQPMESAQPVTAYKCDSCGHVWDPELGDLTNADEVL